MTTSPTDLALAEVKERVLSAPDEVVRDLADMGRWRMEQAVDSTARLDGKAATLVGFGSGLLAFVVMMSPGVEWASAPLGWRAAMFAGAAACVVAVAAAVVALKVQTFYTISDDTWLHPTVLPSGALHVQRFWITAWHQAHARRIEINRRKARALSVSQIGLAVGAIAFAAAVLALAVA